jgi:transketolase
VEQLASLRAVPGLADIRPCDANEVAEAWRVIMEMKHEPLVLILSRQALPTLDRSKFAPASGLRRGAYVLSDATNGKQDVLLFKYEETERPN